MSTFKNLQKIRESFRNIVLGLLDNKDLEAVNCLIFIYGIVMDKLDIGVNTRKQRNTLKKDEESIFIVPVAPKRTGAVAKTWSPSKRLRTRLWTDHFDCRVAQSRDRYGTRPANGALARRHRATRRS